MNVVVVKKHIADNDVSALVIDCICMRGQLLGRKESIELQAVLETRCAPSGLHGPEVQ